MFGFANSSALSEILSPNFSLLIGKISIFRALLGAVRYQIGSGSGSGSGAFVVVSTELAFCEFGKMFI